jgi:hypothetical protein
MKPRSSGRLLDVAVAAEALERADAPNSALGAVHVSWPEGKGSGAIAKPVVRR